MRSLIILIALAGAASMARGAFAQGFDDPFKDYLERSDTILLGAGNAKDTNAAIHTITPWPPYVGNTHIPIDGRRAVESVERMHRVPNPFERQGAERPPVSSGTDGVAAAVNNLGNGSPAPVQPFSAGN